MVKTFLQFALVGALGWPGTAAAQDVERPAIAVLPLKPQRFPQETAKVLDGLLVQALHDAGRHQVISLADISAMLDAEKLKDALACDSTSCAIEISGALGTRFLAFGTVSQLGDRVIVNLTMIDSRDSRVVNRVRSTVQNDENNFERAVDVAVRRLYQLEELPRPAEGSQPKEPFRVELGDVGTRVIFETDPPGSVVLLDGKFLCQSTPCSKFIEAGRHEVRVFADDPCHFAGDHTVEVLDQPEQTARFAGEPREAGIRVFLADVAGNDLAGTVEVDGEDLGVVPGAFTIFACAKKIQITSDDGRVWKDQLDLEADTASDIRAVLSKDGKRVVPVEPKTLGMMAGVAFGIETYRQVMIDGNATSVPTERQMIGQAHGGVRYGPTTVGAYVPYNLTIDGTLRDGVGDAAVYVNQADDELSLAGWVRLPNADEGQSSTQDGRLGLTEFGAKMSLTGEVGLGFGMTYARRLGDPGDDYDRWSVLLDGSMEVFEIARVYLNTFIPLGSDDRDIAFDRVGTYFDTGVVASWRFGLTDWLAVSTSLDLRFTMLFPPDPPEGTGPETPNVVIASVLPTVSAHLFRTAYVRVRLARFQRVGVPWGTERYEGFAYYQNNGAKVAPVPVVFELGFAL